MNKTIRVIAVLAFAAVTREARLAAVPVSRSIVAVSKAIAVTVLADHNHRATASATGVDRAGPTGWAHARRASAGNDRSGPNRSWCRRHPRLPETVAPAPTIMSAERRDAGQPMIAPVHQP